MRVAGFGFRKGAQVDSLVAALEAAGGRAGLDAIATVEGKADAPAFREVAVALGVPVVIVRTADLPAASVITASPKSERMYGTGSLSEAAALVAAGARARLVAARVISGDSMATCAIAEGQG